MDNMTERKSIGFVRSGTHPQNLLVYKSILEVQNLSVFAVCDGISEKKQYNETIKVYCFEEFLRKKWDEIHPERLREYQKEYNEYNLWEIYYTDRYLRYKYDYEDASKRIIGLVMFWENVFDSENAICIAADCIIGAYNFFGMIVGKKREVPYVSFPTSRVRKYTTYFAEGEGFLNCRSEELLKNGYEPTELELKHTEEYIDQYIKKQSRPYYLSSEVNKSKKLFVAGKELIGKIFKVGYIFDGRFNNKFDSRLYKDTWSVFDSAKEAIRSKKIKKYFCEPNYGKEQYVLVPLHYQPEASTCVYARKYENQLFFIEQLSKSIPAGLMIYVKEHIVRLGHRPLSFYKELEKYPNIKLITPYENIHKLILNSNYLVVLTSTVGYEALMYGKPVFICGEVFYENFSGAKKIRDVFDEKDEFRNPPKQNRKLYIKQMTCYLKTLNICSTIEEQMTDENENDLYELRKKTIKSLLDYLNIENSIQSDFQLNL